MHIPSSPFWFLRHGQTDWNKEHRIMGQTDIPLNQTGIDQAQKAAQLLKDKNFKTIISSPLKRTLQTAEIVAAEHDTPIIIMDQFKEAGWGTLEGTLKDSSGAWFYNWKQGIPVEGAEFFVDYIQRVRNGLQQALVYPSPILIVSHGGVYWVMQEILKLANEDISNCSPIFHHYNNNQWMTLSE
jgi:probable phosphoglycerate mutase